ncbi:MAG: alkaline phosphatase family protein [Terriglobales bacterium]
MAGVHLLSKIEHIVVLMMENRSFDNLLGWLYDPANDAPFNVVPRDFDGLYGKDLSNRAPDGRIIPADKTDDPRSPQPNPGEPFEDAYSQIYDVPKVALGNVPSNPPTAPNMQGFIRNYAVQKDKPDNPTEIMQSLTPKTLPVLSSLAHHYALCDRWFASIPTQTFCNRSFVHAGTSSGYVNNGGGGLCFVNDSPTIFDLLEAAGKAWTIFCGGWLLQSFTLLTQRPLWKYALSKHFAHFKEFVPAAGKKGGLPNYSFIEPIYFDSLVWGPENDMHPECNPYQFFGGSNLHRGEALLATIYNAIRNGPDWESTLLIILFDEHGGCYDHVPPPSVAECDVAIVPDGKIIPANQPGGAGFKFDRLGPRVPAIIVSAYTPPQTRLHRIFEHTSILSTVVNCFGLPQGKLGARQAKALDVGDALPLPNPRTDRAPVAKPHFSLLEDLGAEFHTIVHSKFLGGKQNPITDLQRAALHGAALFTGAEDLHDRIANIETELEADLLRAESEAKFAKSKNG